jgi:hypothetical protein
LDLAATIYPTIIFNLSVKIFIFLIFQKTLWFFFDSNNSFLKVINDDDDDNNNNNNNNNFTIQIKSMIVFQ